MVFKISIIAVGKIKEQSINSLIQEYEKRLGPFVRLSIKEIKDEGIDKESSKIKELLLNQKEDIYILDAKGQQFSSEEFSSFLKKKQEIVLIIGGPDGISESVKRNSKLISLSSMTLTHEMCRLLLMEQIYRAVMIEKGRKYHK